MSTVKKSYVTFDLCVSFRVISLKVKKKKKKASDCQHENLFWKIYGETGAKRFFFRKREIKVMTMALSKTETGTP